MSKLITEDINLINFIDNNEVVRLFRFDLQNLLFLACRTQGKLIGQDIHIYYSQSGYFAPFIA